MICELAIFASSFTFCRGQHEWRQRPLDFDKTGKHGEKHPYVCKTRSWVL